MNAIDKYLETRKVLFDKEGVYPHSKYIDIRGPIGKVHYLEIGHGQPLILIHGAGAHSSHWYNIIRPLSEHYHLYILDCPGNGLSEKFDYKDVDFKQLTVDFLHSFMEGMGLQKAIFIGNSLGGYYSINFAIKHPEKVEKLLLVGAPGGINRWIPVPIRFLGLKGFNRAFIKAVKPTPFIMRLIFKHYLVHYSSQLSNDFLVHETLHLLMPGVQDTFLDLCERLIEPGGFSNELYIGDELNKLKVPVRFIWGDRDAFGKPDVGINKAKQIADYKFEVIKDAGHLPWIDKPQECLDLIFNMLDY